MRNTVWEKIGPGWCGTGLIQIQLDSGNSFTINIADPQEEETWRVGIVLMHSPYGDEEEIWSQSIR